MFNDLTENDILNSIEDIIRNPNPNREISTDYSVWFHYELYSPKPIIRRAYELKSEPIPSFNTDQAQERLLDLGFPIVNKVFGKTNSRFSEKELLSFSRLIARPKYDPHNDVDKNIRLFLRDMTWNKTKFWAELLRDKGWEISGRKSWNIQNRKNGQSYKQYTWWRIFPKGHVSDLVYFTVGVHTNGALVYKMDIQHEDEFFKRSPERKAHFEKRSSELKARWCQIEVNEVENYSLEELSEKANNFLLLHLDSYHDIVRELNEIQPIVAVRICWNENGWRNPSGKDGKSTSNSFESEHGFGHDEWLLDLDSQKDGKCYARLQNFADFPKNRTDRVIDMMLFTYNRSINKNQWIGRINNVSVISKEESEEVSNSEEGKSWFIERIGQLNKKPEVNSREYVNTAKNDLYNIRFKPSDVEIYSPFIPDIHSLVPTINRYVINPISQLNVDQILNYDNENRAKGDSKAIDNSNELPNPKEKINKSSASFEREYENIHGLIQEGVIIWLRKKEYTVRFEQRIVDGNRSVDIVVDLANKKQIFIEVKSFPNIDTSVRAAVGQLLEYNFFIDNERATKLVIISHLKTKDHIGRYLQNLRERLKVEIYYLQYDLDSGAIVDWDLIF